MPSKMFDFASFKRGNLGAGVFIARDVARLKLTDTGGVNFDRGGTFKQDNLILPSFRALKLTSLFGIEVDADFDLDSDENELGIIDFQISNDGGSTFLFFSGSWIVAGSTDFNTQAVVNTNIATFPLGVHDLVFKIRLTPATTGANPVLQHTPRLRRLFLHYELRYDFLEDFKRSLKRYLDTNMAVRQIDRELSAGTDTVTIKTKFTISTVTGVFNLTDDPNRNTNIFSSILGNIVTLTAAQDSGDIIETQYEGKAPVVLSANQDFKLTALPVFMVQIPDIAENRSFRLGNDHFERNISLGTAKIRRQRLFFNVNVLISCLSEREIGTLAMAQDISRLFEYEKFFVSEGTGEEFAITDFTPLDEEDEVRRALYNKRIALVVSAPAPQELFVGGKLAQEINLGIGTFQRKTDTVQITP